MLYTRHDTATGIRTVPINDEQEKKMSRGRDNKKMAFSKIVIFVRNPGLLKSFFFTVFTRKMILGFVKNKKTGFFLFSLDRGISEFQSGIDDILSGLVFFFCFV